MSADKIAVNESGHITLKVANQSRCTYIFKVWKNKPLRRLMRVYCRPEVGALREAVFSASDMQKILKYGPTPKPCLDAKGLNIKTVTFRFDGHLIKETETPAGLDMENEDTIDVFQ